MEFSFGRGNFDKSYQSELFSKFGNWFRDNIWKRFTGESQQQQQMQLLKYQQQLQEEWYNKYSSPQALVDQYRAAGLNPGLLNGSSALAGQHNTPSAEGYGNIMPKTLGDKLNHAFGMISGYLGLRQMMYQTDAAREAVEQQLLDNSIKRESLSKMIADNTLEGYVRGRLFPSIGSFVRTGKPWQFKGYRLPYVDGVELNDLFSKYHTSIREGRLYDAGLNRLRYFNQVGQNFFNYGVDDQGKTTDWSILEPIYYTRARQLQLDYDIDAEMKAYLQKTKMAGILGNLLIQFLRSR